MESPIAAKIIEAAKEAAWEHAPTRLWHSFDDAAIDLQAERLALSTPPQGATDDDVDEFFNSGLGQIEIDLWVDTVEAEKIKILKVLKRRADLSDQLLINCPEDALADHEALSKLILDGADLAMVLNSQMAGRWPETYAWLKTEMA